MEHTTEDVTTLTLELVDALSKDAGRAVVRIDPEDISALGLSIGDIVTVEGERQAVAKVLPMHPEGRGQKTIQADDVLRRNARAELGDPVQVGLAPVQRAASVTIQPVEATLSAKDLEYVGRLVDGLPVQGDDRMRVALPGSRWVEFKVLSAQPGGAVLIGPQTKLYVEAVQKPGKRGASRITYGDIGGLKPQLRRIREMIELPLRNPGVFKRLGIDAPKGVLLSGPPGCGKTLLARTIAAEAEAQFFSVSGPEIIRKFYGESEAQLRAIFDKATQQAPSIIFIDEIDAIAPRREDVEGDVEKRVVATLLTLMDGLKRRGSVIVIAATNRPNAIDPALRRAGRFDREIAIPVPDRRGREEVLAIHSRGMPLAADVDLASLAEITHGFVGADLEALCREAAMAALRRTMADFGLGGRDIPYDDLASIQVTRDDFIAGLHDVQPSATREVFVEIPDVRWDEIGGMDAVRTHLREAIEWPLRYADLYSVADIRPSRGILMAGPPGCGKTLTAKAVATESNVNFISIKGPALLSKYIGESERKVRDVFRKAREAAPCIIFFDELDALAPARNTQANDQVSARVLAQFLAEMDGVEDLQGVVVLGATNRLDILDPALLRPGRFDEVVHVTVPDEAGRRDIFGIHLRKKPLSGDVRLDELVEATPGFSGAEVAAVCRRAALDAMRELVHAMPDRNGTSEVMPDASRLVVSQEHLVQAVEHVRSQRAA